MLVDFEEEAEAERKRKAAEEEKPNDGKQDAELFEKALAKWGLKRDAEKIDLDMEGIKDDDCNLLAAIIRENKNLKGLDLSEYFEPFGD